MGIDCMFNVVTPIGFGLVVASAVFVHAAEPGDVQTGLAWVTPKVEAPGVSFHTFESRAAKATVSYHLYLLDGYSMGGYGAAGRAKCRRDQTGLARAPGAR